MRRKPRSVRQRTLIPLLAVCWKARDDRSKGRPHKEQLLSFRCVDLELEAQYRDVRQQLDEYDRSREPEVRGKWNSVCPQCGYINHERHRYCESCGCSLGSELGEVVHICPSCRASIAKHDRECHVCGARFWSPIILCRPVGEECDHGTGEDLDDATD
jgi:hypothetical protein